MCQRRSSRQNVIKKKETSCFILEENKTCRFMKYPNYVCFTCIVNKFIYFKTDVKTYPNQIYNKLYSIILLKLLVKYGFLKCILYIFLTT